MGNNEILEEMFDGFQLVHQKQAHNFHFWIRASYYLVVRTAFLRSQSYKNWEFLLQCNLFVELLFTHRNLDGKFNDSYVEKNRNVIQHLMRPNKKNSTLRWESGLRDYSSEGSKAKLISHTFLPPPEES